MRPQHTKKYIYSSLSFLPSLPRTCTSPAGDPPPAHTLLCHTMTPFVFSLLIAVCLLPLHTPARPATHMLVERQNSNSSTRMDGDLVFNIAFSLALLLALLGSFAWLATGRAVAQLVESFNRMHAALVAASEQLANLRLSSLVERAAATIVNATDDANTANTPRRGGPSYPVATVPWDRVQSGGRGPGRHGGAHGRGGDPPPSAPST